MSWACEVITKGRLWPFFGDQPKKMIREEFERLSLSELPWLYSCAVHLTKDSEMAEDLVQDTFSGVGEDPEDRTAEKDHGDRCSP